MEGILRTNLGEALLAQERLEAAERELSTALGLAREGQDRAREGQALRYLGALHASRGQESLAMAHLDEALKIGSLLDDLLLVSEVLSDRGSLHRERGRFDDATTDWARAAAGFRALGAHRDAERVAELLASLPGTASVTESPS